MANFLRKLSPWRKPSTRDYNKIVDGVNMLMKFKARGPGVRYSMGMAGPVLSIAQQPSVAANGWKTWKILAVATSDAAGDNNDYSPYYRCQEQIIDNALFNTAGDSDVWASVGTSDLIVCNVSEVSWEGSDVEPAMIPSDLLFGYETRDNAGKTARIGYPEAHKHVRWAKTQEAASDIDHISVKLLQDDNATESGNAFDATIKFVDAAIANGNDADECTPQIVSGAILPVSKVGGRWYAYITMTYMDICT